jgi:hypothetical protein
MDHYASAPGEERLARRRFLALVAGGATAVAVAPLLDGPAAAWAASLGDDDWESQKNLITTADEFAAWVDAVIKALEEYRTRLKKALEKNPDERELRAVLGRSRTSSIRIEAFRRSRT